MADQLFEDVFGKDTDVYSLEEITQTYPAFSLAHFYLLKQTEKNHKDYAKRAALAGLYSENTLQLNTRLQEMGSNSTAELIAVELQEEKVNESEILIEKEEEVSIQEKQMEEMRVEEEVSANEAEKSNTGNAVYPNLSISQPAEPGSTALFEPLHTTDYFASQGIKLSEEQKSDDKLGKQLRSFTDWLKTMKKVHDSTVGGVAPEDTTVRIIAENSNRDEEVVTESMAEVLAEQGKHQKAIDIYQKLSLLNPAKSAYFASKIDLLKEK